MISPARKGMIPLKIVSRGISGAIPLMTKTLTPTGGVMTPISPTSTTITPNQMGSKFSFNTSGKKIGISTTMRAMESMKNPPIKKMNVMTAMMANGGIGRFPTQSARRKGIMDTAIKWPNTTAPVIMHRTMQPVRNPFLPASKNFSQVSSLRIKPMTKAPPAPMAPACVGLNQPRNNPPMAKRKRMVAG